MNRSAMCRCSLIFKLQWEKVTHLFIRWENYQCLFNQYLFDTRLSGSHIWKHQLHSYPTTKLQARFSQKPHLLMAAIVHSPGSSTISANHHLKVRTWLVRADSHWSSTLHESGHTSMVVAFLKVFQSVAFGIWYLGLGTYNWLLMIIKYYLFRYVIADALSAGYFIKHGYYSIFLSSNIFIPRQLKWGMWWQFQFKRNVTMWN